MPEIADHRVRASYLHGFRYMFKQTSTNTNITTDEINDIPLPKATQSIQHHLESVVERILNITKDVDYPNNPLKLAKVKELERQIDQMVYELYGLMPEEIAVVEGTN